MSQRQIAQKQIEALILKFRQNEDSYRNGSYNETQLRREFLDPFFEALGWDVINKQGLAEQYKDVIHEDAIKVGEQTKAPDYSFRVGGQRKFFVEAKKPSVSIKDDIGPAYQVRRYSWSAKLPLALLSDFDELAVYDCRQKPKPADKASVGRVAFYTYDQYLEKFDEIYDLFSKEAVLKGAFDKFAQADAKKKGTTEVDKEFLKDIEHWREILAKSIALRNDKLSNDDLNYAVQTIIDRIIFLRICEDRNLEASETLKGLLTSENVYKRLINLFKQADDRYNAGLFDFNKDQITTKLKIDDKVFEEIIGQMYYPASPYVFSQMPIEILGQVYEQFLGKVIRLTAGHHAKVEEKPEVRKAGGVYYTPQYIVDYIVKNTVGELVNGKAPKEIETIRILDPACGSGSFLIGAYKYLLEYHLNWYVNNEPKKYPKAVFTDGHGAWRLTTQEAKKILLNNIFGVDIDSQAVEVTKLSLLLKVLENESREGIEQQLKIFKERALPNIDGNIKCGNSLIGPDFYEGQLDFSPALPAAEREEATGRSPKEKPVGTRRAVSGNEYGAKIYPFDWDREFPEIMKRGGFSAVIGNPPYIRIQGFPKEQINYFTKHYQSATGNCDIYVSFVERGYRLLKDNGLLGYIVPNKFFRTDYGIGLRGFLSSENAIHKIIDFGAEQVFEATIYTCLLFLKKSNNIKYKYGKAASNHESLKNTVLKDNSSDTLTNESWTFGGKDTRGIQRKLKENTVRLLDLPADMSRGSSSGADDVFIVEKGDQKVEKESLREPIFATDFGRYWFLPSGKWKIIFPYVLQDDKYRLYDEKEFKNKYPRAYNYLYSNQNILKKRKQYKKWYAYSAARNLELHDKAQIFVPLLAKRGSFALIPNKYHSAYCPMASAGFTITISEESSLNIEFILGLLNSTLLYWCLKNISNVFRGGWITCTKQYFGELPIKRIDFSKVSEKKIHDQVTGLVKIMSELKGQQAKNPNEKETIARQIAATDKQIDKLVYGLYGLTEEEIKVVEGE